MQSLIHGNFEGDAQRRVYALVGAAAAIAAAVGPLLGGFITTYLSWRVGFALEVVIIAVVLSGIGLVRDAPYTGDRHVDVVGSILSVIAMGGIVLSILVWQEGGEAVAALLIVGVIAMGTLVFWLTRRKREGKPTLLDPDLFKSKMFRFGITGKRGGRRRPAGIIRAGFILLTLGLLVLIPIIPRASSGWWMAIPLIIAGSGLGLLVSQLNNYTLSPISEERVSEAAGVNSAGGSFGLSFGLAFAGAIMLATLSFSFNHLAAQSKVLSPAQQQRIADTLEHDAEIMSNTALQEQIADEPQAVQDEVLAINSDASHRALQVALLIPLLAGLIGLVDSFRMMRLPDPKSSSTAEGMALG
jgi:MFS family permease